MFFLTLSILFGLIISTTNIVINDNNVSALRKSVLVSVCLRLRINKFWCLRKSEDKEKKLKKYQKNFVEKLKST